MKKILLLGSVKLFVTVLFITSPGCKKKKEEIIQPAFDSSYLIGNWKTIPNGQPYLRWTLDGKKIFETWVKSDNCEPVVNVFSMPYAIVNDTLKIDWGIPPGVQDNFYVIRSLTPTRLVLYRTYFKEEAIFEKCQ